ncbi:MAG TPA: TonB family protein [Vicinamibacterales bacterium]|jgi:TonB family protein|nr:TonB family protein [Vicinamibacterales bacterium]
MDVTDVLRDRMEEPSGLQTMVGVSIVVHAAVIAAALIVPAGLFPHRSEAPAAVMTISLGGGEGPRNGGMTAMGGRPVQAVTPPEAKREAVRPPAAKAPEMTIPAPNAKPAKTPPPAAPVKQAPDEARGRTPTRGAETKAGSAVAETGARGQGFGLSTGGGAGSGLTLDVANFCCPDYLVQMIDRIRSNWAQQAEVASTNVVKFTIQRDGKIVDISLERSSGYQNLDLSSQRALLVTRTLNPLPAQFPNPTLTINLTFEYKR